MNKQRPLRLYAGLLTLLFVLFVVSPENPNVRTDASAYFHQVEMLEIEIPALSRPSLEDLQSEYVWLQDVERDTSPTEALTLTLSTVLREGEERISWDEYQYRLRGVPMLGYQQLAWLVDHQDEHPQLMELVGRIYIHIDGPAIVAVSHGGLQAFPSLNQNHGRWELFWNLTDENLLQRSRVAVAQE